jgi:putative transposase
MPKNLKRYYGRGDLHFLTFSCYRRLPGLGTAKTRNEFLRALDEVRMKYGFALVGYVVMPEHVHLLMSEPKIGTPSTVVPQPKAAGAPQFWQRRFYDFNVYSAEKRREKLEYMHRNPVTRRLVEDPQDWIWSSYSSYSGRGTPLLEIEFIN